MDEITQQVQDFYQAYPYPSGIAATRACLDPQNLLAVPASTEEVWILEAGCGCGAGLIELARRYPGMHFIGIDISTRSIELAIQAAADLPNIRFHTANLLTSGDIERPPEGFALIYSFGVLSHLADAEAGLRNLGDLLSPDGRLACMFDGRYGRQPLERLIESIELASPQAQSAADRLAMARVMARQAEPGLLRNTPWQRLSELSENEFADACLHVFAQSYDVEGLWNLFERAGMRFERWLQPDDWAVEALVADAGLRRQIADLDPQQQYALIERLFSRPALEVVLSRATPGLKI